MLTGGAICLRFVYIGVFTSTKMLAFWPQFLCLSSWMYMTAKASKSMHLGTWHFKKRTFSIFQTASPQGFPLNLPCLNLYLWQKTCTSMAKTSDENAEQKRQCKRAFIVKVYRDKVAPWGNSNFLVGTVMMSLVKMVCLIRLKISVNKNEILLCKPIPNINFY